MSNKRYVCDNDYDGAFVGTLNEIDEWLASNGQTPANCSFYEIGKEVRVGLSVLTKEKIND